MLRVVVLALLLTLGLIGSQVLPRLFGAAYANSENVISLLTMVSLAYIMIQVGREFDLEKSRLRQYGWDYVVAMTAAALPWLFVAGYFVLVMLPEGSWPAWRESLLTARFAAPTSAGVLFGMLSAAGLAETWVFKKARFLAIFDDLDTVLLMVLLKLLVIGLAWELFVVAGLVLALFWLAWSQLRRFRLPSTWPWVLAYGAGITAVSEGLRHGSAVVGSTVSIHMEVLLPAFVLGCVLAPERDRARIDLRAERNAAAIMCGGFMLLVGLNMPLVTASPDTGAAVVDSIAAAQPMPGWGVITVHVLAVTALANAGKLFPSLCYRREASWRERLALAIGLWPRGEVGAGVLVVSLDLGIGGPIVTVALLSLLLNLVLTGVFVWFVKSLTLGSSPWPPAQSPHVTPRKTPRR
jgi:Kef-type K+ transport system membrane component KefB